MVEGGGFVRIEIGSTCEMVCAYPCQPHMFDDRAVSEKAWLLWASGQVVVEETPSPLSGGRVCLWSVSPTMQELSRASLMERVKIWVDSDVAIDHDGYVVEDGDDVRLLFPQISASGRLLGVTASVAVHPVDY